MAVANRSVIINVTPEQFYSVVADFEAYPEFCNDVEAIEVLSRDGDSARVLFTIRVVKSIQYTLNLVGRPHSELKWTLHSSKWFKHNNGGWDIKDLGDGRIEASYGVDVGVGVDRDDQGLALGAQLEIFGNLLLGDDLHAGQLHRLV